MLADDGRVVFLDFGLMSTVPDEIMDAFALGIQSVLKVCSLASARARPGKKEEKGALKGVLTTKICRTGKSLK